MSPFLSQLLDWLKKILAARPAPNPTPPAETPPANTPPVSTPSPQAPPAQTTPPVVVPSGPDTTPKPDQSAPGGWLPPATFTYPAEVVGKSWKVTLESGKEVKYPELATYKDQNFRVTDDGRAAQLRVHFGAGTTSGSSNSRCEWRELKPDGKTLASWSTFSGRHVMVTTLRVDNHCKARPHLVIAQIHDGDDDVTVFRLEDTTLWLTNGDNTHAFKAATNFQLGTIHTLGFDVSNGVVSYMLDGVMLNYKLPVKKSGCYFKSGAYLQANKKTAPSGTKDMYAQVTTFSLSATHTGT